MKTFAEHIHNYLHCNFNFRIISFSLLLLGIVIFCPESLFAQDLWLGLEGGMVKAWNTTIMNGAVLKPGLHSKSLSGGFSASFRFPNSFVIRGFYSRFDYDVGANYHKQYVGYFNTFHIAGGLEIKAWGLEVRRDFRIPDTRVLLSPGLGLSFNKAESSEIKIWEYEIPSIGQFVNVRQYPSDAWYAGYTIGCTAGWEFANGMRLLLAGHFLSSFSKIGFVNTEIRKINGDPWENYKYPVYITGIQPTIGLHYPISRIWRGKPSQP